MFNLLGSLFQSYDPRLQQASLNEQMAKNQALALMRIKPWGKLGFGTKTIDEWCRDVIEGRGYYTRSNQGRF